MTLTYDITKLRYLGKSSLPSDDNANDGQINWTNLFPGPGGLAPDAKFVITAAFHAEAVASPAILLALASGTDAGKNPVPLAGASEPLLILPSDPGPCQDILLDGGFEGPLGNWKITRKVGAGCPLPVAGPSGNNPHSGAASLRLGSVSGCPSAVALTRSVVLPNNVTKATFSFWYRMVDPVSEAPPPATPAWPPDSLLVLAFNPSTIVPVLQSVYGTKGWTYVEAGITKLAGSTAELYFYFLQDGQVDAPSPEVFIDDVQVCIQKCGAPTAKPGDPTAPSICWKAGDYVDYAPSGVPDFDQRQEDWRNGQAQWTHDGPTALANSLWWFDSKFEPGTAPPPTISDGYPLLASGQWDDHAPEAVAPLIADLAARADTNGARTQTSRQGTSIGDLRDAAESILADRGLLGDYTITLEPKPDFDWVRTEISRSEDIVLLLGFWEHQADGWRRLGGHYVTSAGVACQGNRIAISDPYFDRAEAGRAGRALPVGPHEHPVVPPQGIHNDAQKVSHDIYDVVPVGVPGATWGLQGYAPTYAEIANFSRLNEDPVQAAYIASGYQNGPIVVVAEYALAASPKAPGVSLRLDPHLRSVSVDEVFTVSLQVDVTQASVDQATVSLGFDPNLLVVVDAQGQPTARIDAGSLLQVVTNTVDNAAGTIDLVTAQATTPLPGDFKLGSIRFRALAEAPAPGTSLYFHRWPGRYTDLFHSGASILTTHSNGQVIVQGRPAKLLGSVALQGRPTAPDPTWMAPLSVTLHQPGASTPLLTFGVQTDDLGRFGIESIVAGTYDIRVKGPTTLAAKRTGLVLGGGDNQVALGTLLEGDANNDNLVDVADASILAASFGLRLGHPSYDPAADFNRDGVVNAVDQGLLQDNYGKSGDQPATAGPRAVYIAGADAHALGVERSAGSTGLRIEPAQSAADRGQVVTVEIILGAGDQLVDALAAHLDFDPLRLMVVNEAGAPTDRIQAQTGHATLANQVNNTLGTIDYGIVCSDTPPLAGTTAIASVRFKVKDGAYGDAWVRFIASGPRETGAYFEGEPVLGKLAAGHILLPPIPHALHLPMLLRQ